MNQKLAAAALLLSCLSFSGTALLLLRGREAAAAPAAAEPARAAAVGASAPSPAAVSACGCSPGAAGSELDARTAKLIEEVWPEVLVKWQTFGTEPPAKPKNMKELLLALDPYWPEIREKGERAGKRRTGPGVVCENNLKQLGVYMALYESKFKAYPAVIADMKRPDMLSDECKGILDCPLHPGGGDAYAYLFPPLGDETSADFPVAWDKELHPDGTRCVLRFYGRVDTMTDADFQKLMDEQLGGAYDRIYDALCAARSRAADASLSPEKRDRAIAEATAAEAAFNEAVARRGRAPSK